MSAVAAIRRLAKEQQTLEAERVCDFYAEPLSNDVFEWHFTLQGPSDTPYAKGLYHGALHFPRDYPFSPPDIVFFTRSGRFDVNKNICSSISSYHPELWNPTYTVSLVLVALRVFMSQEEEMGIGLLTGRYTSKEDKMRLAEESHTFACEACGMASAHKLWEAHMKGHPPVSPDLETSVPKVPTLKPANDGKGEKSEEKEKEAEKSEERPKEAEKSEERPKEAEKSEDRAKEAEKSEEMAKKHVQETSAPAKDISTAPAASAQETAERRKEFTKTAERSVGSASASPAPGGREEEAKAERPAAAEATTNEVIKETKKKDERIIRIRFGDRVVCRMKIQQLDVLIALVSVIFFSLLINKIFTV